jgi:DNA-binding beta-propeller fold protein YncE
MRLDDKLVWSATANALQYTLSRSSTSGGPYTVLATQPGTTYFDNQFVDDGTYYYVVTVTDANGTSLPSTELAVAQQHEYCIVTDTRIGVFPRVQNGDGMPIRAITGPDTGITHAFDIAVDFIHDEIILDNYSTDAITTYARTADGDVIPVRTIAGPTTGLSTAYGVAVDPVHGEIFVADYNTKITVYDRLANGDVMPLRTLTGPSTGLTYAYSVAVDPVHDELLVANYAGQNYLVFDRTAMDDTPPKRTVPASSPVGIAVDTIHDEIFVAYYNGAIQVFPRLADGSATTPSRTLNIAAFGVAYDPLHDELMVTRSGGLSVFPRTAMNTDPPVRVIEGGTTGFGNAWYSAVCY